MAHFLIHLYIHLFDLSSMHHAPTLETEFEIASVLEALEECQWRHANRRQISTKQNKQIPTPQKIQFLISFIQFFLVVENTRTSSQVTAF